MNNNLYRRKPKTLLQKVWFWVRPQIVEATKLKDYSWMRGQDPIDGVYRSSDRTLFSAEYFEANYEPITEIAPIAPSKNELHQVRGDHYADASKMVDQSLP